MESSVFRPTIMEVDLDSLKANYYALKRLVGSRVKVMAVLKANAYGHGLIACAKVLAKSGVDYFGVALLEEGIALRKEGIAIPIHVFGGILTAQIREFLKYDLEITASSVSKLQAIEEAARGEGKRAKVHIKLDTGMGRIGQQYCSSDVIFKYLKGLRHVDVVGVFSHFATSDEPDTSFSMLQLKRFNDSISYIKSELKIRPLYHIANSSALIRFEESRFDMVRAGLALYGVRPSVFLKSNIELVPVMSIKSRIVFFKVLKKGDSVSYGRSYILENDSRIVTIPIGYGDGYPRALSNVAHVLIHGRRYPVVGNVCMDQLMVNIGTNEAYNGDEVVIVGKQCEEDIPVEELSCQAHTCPHEILSGFNLRIPRKFLLNGQIADF